METDHHAYTAMNEPQAISVNNCVVECRGQNAVIDYEQIFRRLNTVVLNEGWGEAAEGSGQPKKRRPVVLWGSPLGLR